MAQGGGRGPGTKPAPLSLPGLGAPELRGPHGLGPGLQLPLQMEPGLTLQVHLSSLLERSAPGEALHLRLAPTLSCSQGRGRSRAGASAERLCSRRGPAGNTGLQLLLGASGTLEAPQLDDREA